MTKVGVYFTAPNELDYPLNKEVYVICYEELSQAVRSQGGDFYIVRGAQRYLGNGTFSKSWQIDGSHIRESGEIKLDAIYDKGDGNDLRVEEDVPILNTKKINDICIDKWLTYKLFHEDCPKTFLAHSRQELLTLLATMNSQVVVVKPQFGECGTGVLIGSKLELKEKLDSVVFPVLVQEFIDSSRGIKNVVNGIHDFRVAILDGEIQYAFVRTPPAGKLSANVALGGTLRHVERIKIPESFLQLIGRVDDKMATFGSRMYSIDMAMSESGPRIIELNSRFGLEESKTHQDFANFTQRLAKKLLNLGAGD
jgi:glutathione synthase/RimK-type ligase-like ATP-grasp enzyme